MYCEPLAKDVSSLRSIGGDFCTSYLGYSPSVVVSTVTETPAVSTIQVTTIELMTETSTSYIFQKRVAVPTPSFIAIWPAKKISAACSQVVTGLTSTTTTTTASTPYMTEIVATSTSTILSPATQTCQASLIKGGDVQNSLKAWEVSGDVKVLEDNSATAYHITSCGYSCSSVGGKIAQSINFGECIDQSYTFEFSYQVSGDYTSEHDCNVGFEISQVVPSGWYIPGETVTSTHGAWKTWSKTFTVGPEVQNLDLDLGLSLYCNWYVQDIVISVKDLTLGPASGQMNLG
jgi:hypothetical protein